MITIFNAVSFFLKMVEVAAVLAIVLIGIDIAAGELQGRTTTKRLLRKREQEIDKTKRRLEKEREAREHASPYFDEFYAKYFQNDNYSKTARYRRGERILDAEARYHAKQMDKLADAEIFNNTEEL